MQINDLFYLETALESPLILGSAGVLVTANALALGDSTATSTLTDAQARFLPSGGSVAIGRGFATASGDVTFTSVTVAGSGDIVAGNTHTTPDGSKSVGVVVAVKLPNR